MKAMTMTTLLRGGNVVVVIVAVLPGVAVVLSEAQGQG